MTIVTTPLASGTKLYVVGDQASLGYSEGVTLVDLNGNPVSRATGHAGPVSISTSGASSAGFQAGLNAYGTLRVSDEPHALFRDLFDAASIDTVGNWNSPAAGSVTPVATSGGATFPTGTTASAWSQLSSQQRFSPSIPGFEQPSFNIQVEATPVTQGSRFWGIGVTPVTPTPAAPLTDAVGWLLDSDGKLYAVIYAGGSALVKIDLSASGTNKQPLDGIPHRYLCQIRTDQVHWYIDNLDPGSRVAFASQTVGTPIVSPNVQTLPVLVQQINGNPQASAMTLKVLGAILADTANNASQQSDANYPGVKETLLPLPAVSVPGGNYGGAAITHDPIVYYASARAGHVAFGASTPLITSPTSGNPFMLFENPVGSGIVLYVWRIVIGSDRAGIYTRYRNPTVATRPTPVTETNIGGGANRSAGKLYGTGGFTLSANGTLAKNNFAAGTGSTGSEVQTDEHLAMQILPGQAVMWTYTGGATNLAGEVVWAEGTAF